jgi:hypothetical protein
MSETLYNTSYYPSLLTYIDAALSPEGGLVVIGTKTFYFGLGGGFFQFKQYLKEQGASKYCLEVHEKLNDLKSIERMVLFMKRGGSD